MRDDSGAAFGTELACAQNQLAVENLSALERPKRPAAHARQRRSAVRGRRGGEEEKGRGGTGIIEEGQIKSEGKPDNYDERMEKRPSIANLFDVTTRPPGEYMVVDRMRKHIPGKQAD